MQHNAKRKWPPAQEIQPLLLVLLLGMVGMTGVAGCSSSSENTTTADQGSTDDQQLVSDQSLDQPAPPTDQAPAADQPKKTDGKPQSILLSNASNQCDAIMLKPDKGEEGQLCAGRLTPPAYPFVVWDIRYRMGHGKMLESEVTCNASLAHRVELYISSEVKPPANPTPVVDFDMPAIDPSQINPEDGRMVIQKIDPPLTLAAGEHLFVAITMTGQHPDLLCIAVNKDDPYEGNRNYWSNATAAPYSWAQLDSFGLKGSILVSAGGYVDQ